MKVKVDREVCESQGVCERLCPAVFSIDDDDMLQIAEGEVSDEHLERVQMAIKRCPKQALSEV